MDLKGKVALITGAGSGIGAEVARKFVREGAKVCIAGLFEEELVNVLHELPNGSAVQCQGDVSKPEDVTRMVETALSLENKIDVLINCAGVSLRGSITDIDLDNWHKSFEVNLHGPFLLMRAVIPHMINSGGGSIINISSLGALRLFTDSCAYSSSKGALVTLTQQAAVDYGPNNIRCNVVCPGFVHSDMTEQGLKNISPIIKTDIQTFLENAFEDIPLRKPGTTDKIASVCFFLASDESDYLTGTVIPVDGGTAVVDVFGVGMRRAVKELRRE